MTTKKREYEKPSMQAFEMKQQSQLLAGSSGNGTLDDYNWNTPSEE